MRISVKRALVAACAAVSVVVVLSSCGLSGESDTGAAAAVNKFASALSRQDGGGAAAFTTAPGQAADALNATLAAMHPQNVSFEVRNPVEYSDGTASFGLKSTWTWAKGHTFEATSNGTARHLSTGWKVTWDPSVIYPGLPAGGLLREIRTDATPSPSVRSRNGKVFMYLQPVTEIVLDPSATPNVDASVAALARVIAPIAPLITPAVIRDQLAAAGGRPIVTVGLRDSDMQVLAGDPAKVSGVRVNKTGQLVMADRRLNSPLESGLTNYWQAIRDATAGWQVQLVGPGMRPRQLAGDQGPAGPNVFTAVDQGVQLTLGDVAVEVGQPATVMVLDAVTGAIQGMAQNDYAVDRKINVDAVYPIGSTLAPVYDAVSRIAGGSESAGAMLLDRLGLGVQFTVPGASAPTPGQAGVTTVDYRPGQANASIMNMAALGVALARAQTGQLNSVAPYVINGVPTKVVGGELGALDRSLIDQVSRAMTATAKVGDASDLTGAPGLRALVGTNGPQGPGWFVGIQGGKVIVIYTEGPKSGTAALQVAQKYFRIK
ncbi:NTF2-like N-terminal transpeptidase domain-containing protein [Gordonia sp. ABSL1-1]|uniref:NTF2-like N-terminal transpeptidase domain-containing protein n=1 Tax=Gordonia sp. ABSL1-1 TaxID=3053923 RepID=UPI002573B9EF|nr:NTF2-like N-terminal transpeptidase domain-containing protein [Gordonia sp. ABSL1-1]MDL9935163.1 NTF2-like N-terminal transpeptidase domain-containing protein [Gordonia sp. ABSL1-1]